MTSVTTKLWRLHGVLTTRRIADQYRRAAIKTLSNLEVVFVKAAQAGNP